MYRNRILVPFHSRTWLEVPFNFSGGRFWLEPEANFFRFTGGKTKEAAMSARRRVKHTTSLEDRIAERTDEIKARAEALPPGSKERERLERRVRLADTLDHITEWITSPGLRPPE